MRLKITLIFTVMLFSTSVCAKINYQKFSDSEIDTLVSSLKSEKYTESDIRDVFKQPSVRKIPDMVTMNVTKQKKLTTNQYAKYAEEPALGRARKYGNLWDKDLSSASERYGVDSEVILAILLVETNLGTYTGKYPVVSVFSSIFVDSNALLSSGKVKRGMRLYSRVKRKRSWALTQLRGLLRMKKELGVNILALKGSFSGAIGICQFLPTSFLQYAVSERDSVPNLFQPPDALRSVAHYLKRHGYRKGLNRQANRKAVYGYNHSDVYVNIVLKIAKNLKKTGLALK